MKTAKEINDPVLSLKDVGVSYWRRTGFFRRERYWALKDLSIDIRPGETMGVIGRNGAGKSTFLRVLSGIIAPDEGRIAGNGGRASLLSIQVGFSPHLSGRDNAMLSGMLLGLRRREVESKMEAIISFAELGDFIDQPIRTYSVGMKARLGFAVAFQTDPDLLLIDEVLGVGDVAFREKSSAAMRDRIHSNRTVVLVSHSPQTIRDLCDRAIWLDRGHKLMEGPVEAVVKGYQEEMRRINVQKPDAV